jgi:protein ImuB
VDGQGIVLEIGASLRLFGGHARLTAAISQGARALGYQVTLGIAPTPLAARLFARAEAQGLPVRACLAIEELAARVAELPLFLLDWPARTLSLLADLGVLRLRDALALPRPGLAKRFGPETVDSLDRLLGHRPDPRTPYAPPQRFRARLELPAEAESTEALLFPLRRLLAQMEGFLRGRGAGVQQLELTLWPVRGPRTRLALAFASPEREADFILALAREKLGRTQLAAPTLVLELRAEALLAFTPRTKAWLPGREEQSIGREHLVQKLAARLGSERVFGIALADDHRPERGWKAGTTKVRALPCGPRPVWLLMRPRRLVAEGDEPAFQGKLSLLAGPERIEAGWWEGEPVSRDYFVAANPGGETYWVYRDHRDPAAWYVHGVFS